MHPANFLFLLILIFAFGWIWLPSADAEQSQVAALSIASDGAITGEELGEIRETVTATSASQSRNEAMDLWFMRESKSVRFESAERSLA